MDDGSGQQNYAQQETESDQPSEPTPAEEPAPASGWENYDYDQVLDAAYADQPAPNDSSGSPSYSSESSESSESIGADTPPSSDAAQSSWGVGSFLSSAVETVSSYIWGSSAQSTDEGTADEEQAQQRQELERQHQELEQQQHDLQAQIDDNQKDIAAHRAGTMLNDAIGSEGGEIADMDPGPLFQNLAMDKKDVQLGEQRSDVEQQLDEVEGQLAELGEQPDKEDAQEHK